jgi:hydrogenase 3 maturation protease
VGNLQRSDDAAGCLVARGLLNTQAGSLPERVLVIEAGPAPENVTGELRRFAPQFVLLADAADMQEAPGAIHWIEMKEISGMSASTHSLPLSMLAEYLRLELGCEVALLGIQPRSNEVGEEVSEAVRRAVAEVVGELRSVMGA